MSNVVPIRQEGGFSLTPSNLTEAFELAKMMADSDLVPKDYRGKPGNVLIAVQMGAELELSPMAAVQSIAVINGKPGIYGDAGKAILLLHGCIIEEADIAEIGKTGVARCRVTRPGRPPVERTYSRDNAKTAGLLGKDGPWRTNPERQMAWRAFWFAARDSAADLLKGLRGREELADYEPEKNMGAADVVPEAKTKADAVADALAGKTDAPTLDSVLLAIKRAETPADMEKAAGEVAKLANIEDKEMARNEWRARLAALKAAAESGPTFAEIEAQIRGAESVAAVNTAQDLVRSVKDDQQRAELGELAAKRIEELTPPAE